MGSSPVCSPAASSDGSRRWRWSSFQACRIAVVASQERVESASISYVRERYLAHAKWQASSTFSRAVLTCELTIRCRRWAYASYRDASGDRPPPLISVMLSLLVIAPGDDERQTRKGQCRWSSSAVRLRVGSGACRCRQRCRGRCRRLRCRRDWGWRRWSPTARVLDPRRSPAWVTRARSRRVGCGRTRRRRARSQWPRSSHSRDRRSPARPGTAPGSGLVWFIVCATAPWPPA